MTALLLGRDRRPKPNRCPLELSTRTPHAVAVLPKVLAVLSIGATLLLATPAAACPNCAVGKQARSEVWNDDFGRNLFVALLPFLVIGAICVRAERIGRTRGPAVQRAASASSLEPESEQLTSRRSES